MYVLTERESSLVADANSGAPEVRSLASSLMVYCSALWTSWFGRYGHFPSSPESTQASASLEGGTDSNLIGLGTEAWFDASGNYIPVGIGAGANAFGVMAGVTLLVLHIAVIARYAYSLSATVQARYATSIERWRECSPSRCSPTHTFFEVACSWSAGSLTRRGGT